MTMMGVADQIFDSMAKGRNSISRSELDPRGQGFYDILARSGNVSGDTMTRQHIDYDFEDRLSNIRSRHRGKRQANVVYRDRDLHPRFELRE